MFLMNIICIVFYSCEVLIVSHLQNISSFQIVFQKIGRLKSYYFK